MNVHEVSLYIKAAVLVLAGLAGGFKLLAPEALYARWRRPFVALSAFLAVLAIAAFFRFGDFIYGSMLHYHDISHYYFGVKYAPELGYFNLYRCIVIAEAEGVAEAGGKMPRIMRDREIRDLETYQMKRLEDIVSDPDEVERCKGRFAPERWAEFRADIEAFYEVQHAGIYYDRCNDMGYNGSPVWGVLARPLAELTPVTPLGMRLLALLDIVLILAAFVLLWRAFDAETALLTAAFYYAVFFNHQLFIIGSFLRFDWMAALIAGLAWLKRGRQARAGVALAYAGLVRLFPFALLFGLLVKAAHGWISTKRLDRGHMRFFIAYGATVVVLASLSLAMFGVDYWREYAAKLDVHRQVVSSTRLGLPYLTMHIGRTFTVDSAADADLRVEALRHNRRVEGRRNAVAWGAMALFALAIAVVSRRRADWETVALSYPLVFLSMGLTVYYCVVVSVMALFFLAQPRRWTHALMWLTFAWAMAASYDVYLVIAGGQEQNRVIGILILGALTLAYALLIAEDVPLRIWMREKAGRLADGFRRTPLAVSLGAVFLTAICAAVVYGAWVALTSLEPPAWQREAMKIVRRGEYDPARDALIVTPSAAQAEWIPETGAPARFMDHLSDEPFYPYARAFVVWSGTAFDPDRYAARPHSLGPKAALSTEYNGSAVSVVRLDFTPSSASRFNLRAKLPKARAWVEENGERRDCRPDGDRFICGDAEWNWVGPAMAALGGGEREAIGAHPTNGTLVLSFPDVVFGDQLFLGAGLSDFAAELKGGAPVTLEAAAGDEIIGTLTQPNAAVWTRQAFDTSSLAGQTRPLIIRIRAANPARRHFYFAGDVVGAQ
ncbi:MAG: DUF2029 domain-containing protein [Myxococcales bacterium]|nr:MAG: DUF2029 domain-containing protein [Myxococcales bacterium]